MSSLAYLQTASISKSHQCNSSVCSSCDASHSQSNCGCWSTNQIKVSTAVDRNLLGVAGAFRDNTRPFIEPIIAFRVINGAPLLANIYPYFGYNNQPVPYVLFTAPRIVVRDGNVEYRNLFDALMDALYSALQKINRGSSAIVVSESGWPSAGGAIETLENADTYYKNLINHVKGGTPKRPGMAIRHLFVLIV